MGGMPRPMPGKATRCVMRMSAANIDGRHRRTCQHVPGIPGGGIPGGMPGIPGGTIPLGARLELFLDSCSHLV